MLKKIIIITTSIIILVASLALPALAAEYQSVAPLRVGYTIVGYTPGEDVIVSGEFGVTDFLPASGFPDNYPYTYNDLIYPEGEFDYYFGKAWNLKYKPNDTTSYNEINAFLEIEYETYNLEAYNSVSFSVGVFVESANVDNEEYDPWDYVWIDYEGSSYPTDDYTMTYTVSEPQHILGTTANYFRTIDVQVYFPETYDYNTDLFKIYATSWMPAFPVNAGPIVAYAFGLTDLKCEVLTTEGLLGNINNAIQETNKQVTIIGDILSTELTDEQRQKLDEAAVRRETVAEYENEVKAAYDSVYKQYIENADPIINTEHEAYIDNNVGVIYDNAEATSLITGFWNNSFVVSCVVLVLSFVAVGYALYGKRE